MDKRIDPVTKNIADAHARDYEELNPEEITCKHKTFCQIVTAICIGILVAAIVTAIIFVASN